MNPDDLERFRKLEEIFHSVLEAQAGPEQQHTLIGRLCGNDPNLQIEIVRLLENDARVRTATPTPQVPMPRFGAWQAIRVLGRGGTGTVYLAERADGAFQMPAAVKVVPLALASTDIEQRFLRERRLLAGLDHPNIARVLDGGVSETGLPYLVMEYIDGTRLDLFCDQRKLDLAERVRLFLEVCGAVECAHRSLVVHLDLKPSNILVTENGSVKLLDFGTSKLIEPDAGLTSTFMLTPFYASPEQLRNEPVTTACDVYALGVILFELLSGRRPAEGATLAQILERARQERDSQRLDRVVTRQAAENRGLSESRLSAILAGDLATIVRKCLAARPADRYASVGTLSDDLDRYLAGRPVLARPQTFTYRGTRFVRRHLVSLSVAAIVTIVLTVSAGYVLLQRAREQRRDTQIRIMSQANLSEIYREVSRLRGSTRARILIVDQARRNLDELLRESPEDPGLRRAGALAYAQLAAIQGAPFSVSMADTAGALASYRRAAQLAAAQPDDWESRAILVQSQLGIAQLQTRSAQYADAEATIRGVAGLARLVWLHGSRGFSPAALQLVGSLGTLYARVNLTLGFVLMAAGDVDPSPEHILLSLKQLEKARAIAEQVHAADPSMPDLPEQFSQYVAYALQGYCERTGDLSYCRQAVAAHHRAVDAAKKAYESSPSPINQRNYADTLAAMSWALRLSGQDQEAVDAARMAVI